MPSLRTSLGARGEWTETASPSCLQEGNRFAAGILRSKLWRLPRPTSAREMELHDPPMIRYWVGTSSNRFERFGGSRSIGDAKAPTNNRWRAGCLKSCNPASAQHHRLTKCHASLRRRRIPLSRQRTPLGRAHADRWRIFKNSEILRVACPKGVAVARLRRSATGDAGFSKRGQVVERHFTYRFDDYGYAWFKLMITRDHPANGSQLTARANLGRWRNRPNNRFERSLQVASD